VIASWWLLFRTSSLRWIVPLSSCACTLLVSANMRDNLETSMQTSSQAALTILVWAPAMLLVAYTSVRASGLSRAEDALVLPMQLRSRLARVGSVVGALFAWLTLGWIGVWAGCSVLAGRRTPIYWSMVLNGVAITALTALVGALLAVQRRPAWVAALASAGSYAGLAVWSYVPQVAASVLYAPYGPLFFTEALPDRKLLLLQLLWSVAAVAVFAAWVCGLFGTPLSLVVVLMIATVTTAGSSTLPQVVSRSGTVPLTCAPRDGVQVCLWADHEATRPRIAAEVDLARTLLRAHWATAYVSEGDLSNGLPAALPSDAQPADTVLVPTSANPAPREAAARIVAAALLPPTRCADLTTAAGFGETVGAAVERLVIEGRSAADAYHLSDDQLADRIETIRRQIDGCHRPDPS
jgi:hypothetical protein